jgi:RND family efflux transporter MFP subunit
LTRRHLRIVSALALLVWAGAADAGALSDYTRSASCLITPNNIYKLSSSVQGTLAKVNVERSDRVKKGDIIAQLESGVEESQVEAAKVRSQTDVQIRLKDAVAAAANAKVERLNKLRAAQIANQQALDDAEVAAATAKADVAQAELDKKMAGFEVLRLEATLERRTIRAPADGVVTSVDLHTGEYADPANPVATITEIDPLKVDVYLPAEAYSLVAVGARARVTPKEPSLSEVREALVTTKDPQIDASSGLFLIQLRLPNPDGAIPAGVRCGLEFMP